MKKLILILGLLLGWQIAQAQTERLKAERFALGFQLNQFQQDFGFGLSISSPNFLKKQLRLNATANVQWLQHPQQDETVWSPYGVYRVGIEGAGIQPHSQIRLYGGGGIAFIAPNAVFSEESLYVSGYGVFGFEFFTQKAQEAGSSMYIELGGMSAEAKADKVPQKPFFATGFTISVGFKYYF